MTINVYGLGERHHIHGVIQKTFTLHQIVELEGRKRFKLPSESFCEDSIVQRDFFDDLVPDEQDYIEEEGLLDRTYHRSVGYLLHSCCHRTDILKMIVVMPRKHRIRFLFGPHDSNQEILKLLDAFCANPSDADSHLRTDVADILEHLVPSPVAPVPSTLSKGALAIMFRAILKLDEKKVFERALGISLSSPLFRHVAQIMIQRHGFA